MADRSISIALEAKVQGFVSGMRTAQQATTDFANRTADFAAKNEQNLDRVGKASMVFGGALLAGVGIAVKAFMEFDSAMSEVQASTHETSANMDLLRDAAINAGADTAFSAKEAAKGIDELAKAGVSTKDILGGGLTGALSLAAAGSLGVGESAEIAATAMTQFKLSGDKIPHLADLLAAGAGKAQGSVQDMGMALKQAGLVAASTGLTIEETTGGLAAFAAAGLIGSDAGTSFKSMLQRLTPQSLEAKNKMTELGISAYDAQGKFIGLAGFAENLKTSMQKLTPEARAAAMGVIFGSDAVRASNVLYEQGAAGIEKYIGMVNDAGYAAVTASIKQDNLAGDIEKLGGSFDSVLIKGGSGVAESLRGLVQGAEDLVDAFGKIPAPILNAGVGIAGIVGSGLLLGGMLMSALPKLMEFRASFTALSKAAPGAATGIKNVGKAAGIATAALVGLQIVGALFNEKHTTSAEQYGQALLKVGNAAGSIDSKGLDSIFGNYDKEFGSAVSNVDNLADAIQRITNQNFNDAGSQFFEPITKFLGFPPGEVSALQEKLKGLGDEMGNLVKNGAGETAAQSFHALTSEFEKNGKGAKEAMEALPGYRDALMAQATAAGVVLSEQDLLDFAMGKVPASMANAAGATETYTTAAGQTAPVSEEMAKALEEIGLSASGTVTDLAKFTEALLSAGLTQLSARDAARNWSQALLDMGLQADGTGGKIGALGTAFDNTTAQGIKNQAMFDGVAQAGIRNAEAMATAGASNGQLQGALTNTYNGLIAAAGQFGITGVQAETLARKVLGVPDGVSIQSWMSDAAKRMAEATGAAADAVNGKTVNVYVNTHATRFEQTVGLPGTMADGSKGQGLGVYAKKAVGGRVYGPGTTTSDSIPHMLSKDEYVIKASAAKAIGYANLDRMNAQQLAPAPAPARQMSMAGAPSSGPTQMTGTLVMDSGEVLGVFRGVAVAAAQGVVSAADSQSQFSRRGR